MNLALIRKTSINDRAIGLMGIKAPHEFESHEFPGFTG